MPPSKVFLSGALDDAQVLEQLTQALDTLGVPVYAGPPAESSAADLDAAPPAIVLMLSEAALASPGFVAALDRYGELVALDPRIAVVPVALEPLSPDALPAWLRDSAPVVVQGEEPEFQETLVRGVLQRLGLPVADAETTEATPSFAADPLAEAALRISQPLSAAPGSGPARRWWQRIERRRRPLVIGSALSLILLLIACVVFSLGVGAPGGGADRLDSGLPGGSGAARATATLAPTVAPLPSASPTRPKPTTTVTTTTTATAIPPTPTPVPPTPTATLGPGTGLRGDYYHTAKDGMGTPVPYPNFGNLWFSRTDPTVYFGYGRQSRTYTPPLGPFDAQVCPSPPTSSPCSPFGVRWTGFVRPRYTETYTFMTDADDGVKLWVNGQLLVDNWQVQPDTQNSGVINLSADQLVSIQIEYYENGEGPATMALQWQSASQALEPVPQSQLYPS